MVRLIRSGASAPVTQHPLLTRIEVAVGNQIDEAPGFAERLLPAAEAALAYFERQVAAIPGPLAVAPGPLFAGSEQISHALGRSLAVKESLPELPADGEICALLGMRLKTGDSNAQPVFADHTLRSLAVSPAACREQLSLAALDRLLRDFAEHVEKLRRKDRMLRIEWEWNLQHDAARVMAAEPRSEYVEAARELTPANMLKGLLSWLASPECFFRLDNIDSTQPPAGSDGAPVAPSLPLLHCSDRRQWLVCLVTFPAATAALALQRETHNHRYILI
ncbi:MAG TPA: hypothetical protein VF096_00885 [Azonexus sp.]